MIRRFVPILAGLVLSATVAAATGDKPTFKQGKNYHLVVPVQPTRTRRDQVQVIEFFRYGCAACAALRPHLERWLSEQPESVLFERVPAVWNPAWKSRARAFYTAKVLGVADRLRSAIHDAVTKNGELPRDEAGFQKFFAAHGVDKVHFESAWASDAVENMMKRAAVLAARYRVRGLPAIAVGGQYITGPTMAASAGQMVDIMNALVHKVLEGKK
jgi:thiol:disulfide interchange protein DsbA